MKKTELTISESEAIRLYPTASKELKLMLEKAFGKEALCYKITDKVKIVADAYKVKGIDRKDIIPFPTPKNNFQEAQNAIADIWIIAEVLCEGWEADYDNSKQTKWFPVYKKETSGFGFSRSIAYYDYTDTFSGSRLCFPTEELSDYFGNQFIETMNIILIKKNN